MSFLPDQAAGERMAMLLQSFSSIGTSVITAFCFCWELTLVCLIMVPFIVIAAIAEINALTQHAAKEKKELEAAGKVGVSYSVRRFSCNSFVLR